MQPVQPPIPRGRRFGTRKHDPSTLTPFARALYAARTHAGETHTSLAAHLGHKPSSIGNAETAIGRSTSHLLSEDAIRAAAVFLRCDPAPLLAARDRSRFSYVLPNLSAEHAETAIALRDAWATLDGVTLARVRAALAGGGL